MNLIRAFGKRAAFEVSLLGYRKGCPDCGVIKGLRWDWKSGAYISNHPDWCPNR